MVRGTMELEQIITLFDGRTYYQRCGPGPHDFESIELDRRPANEKECDELVAAARTRRREEAALIERMHRN